MARFGRLCSDWDRHVPQRWKFAANVIVVLQRLDEPRGAPTSKSFAELWNGTFRISKLRS